MQRLYAFKGAGWFSMGIRWPMPETWQGWLALLLFVVAILATLPFDGSDAAWPVRMVIAGLFFGTVFWTLERSELS